MKPTTSNSGGPVEAWVAGEVLIDLIPDGEGGRHAIVGGGSANTAKALARLGIATCFIDGISSDAHGRAARAELEAAGVDLRRSLASDKPTALAEVTLDGAGKASYAFSLAGTATFDFSDAWLPRGTPAVLHVGTLATIVEPGCDALHRWAGGLSCPVVYDPNVRPSVRPAATEAPASLPRGVCAESPAAERRHGARDREHRQATRRRCRRACGRWSRHGRLLRRASKAPISRHLADCLGETDGAGGGGVSARVPELRRRHPAQRRRPAGAG